MEPLGTEETRSFHQVTRNRDGVEKARRFFPGAALGLLRLPDDRSFVVSRGRGPYLYDVENRRYIDYVLGSGPLLMGHAHPAVVLAVSEAVGRGSTFYYMNEPALALAAILVSSVSCAERVRFMSSGSEATYLAVRLARAFTGRAKVLKFEGGFHGFHDLGMMSMAPRKSESFPAGEPYGLGVGPGVHAEVLVAPYNNLPACQEMVGQHEQDLACILVEPIQRDIVPESGFLAGLRQLADRSGAMLIFDEVVTGYRLTFGGAQDYFGTTPDLAAFGKIIGGGYPLSAIVGRAELMDLCDEERSGSSAYVSGTLSGNPIGAVAGLATLRELAKPGVYARLHEMGERLRSGIRLLLEEASIPGVVVGLGPMANVYFGVEEVHDYRSAAAADRRMAQRFGESLLGAGIFVNPGKKLYLSAAHTTREIDATLDAVSMALKSLRDTMV